MYTKEDIDTIKEIISDPWCRPELRKQLEEEVIEAEKSLIEEDTEEMF